MFVAENKMFSFIIQVVSISMCLLLAAFVVFNTLAKRDTRQLKILTLISKTYLKKGQYKLSFDVLKDTDCDRIKKERREEDEEYEELECIEGACSDNIQVKLSSKTCWFNFTVSESEPLQPERKLENGEDCLNYDDSLPDNRKCLYFTPTNDGSSERAYVKFWYNKKVEHKVIIDVSSLSTPRKDNKDGTTGTLMASTPKQALPVGANPAPGPSDDIKISRRASGTIVLSTSKHVGANPAPGPISRPCFSSDQCGELPGFSSDETAYDKIVSSKSLHWLSTAVSPNDSLLRQLHVPESVIAQKKTDFPRDTVSVTYHCLKHWKDFGKTHHHTNKQLYEDLLKQLKSVGSNGIKVKLMEVLTANRELEQTDFQHL